MGFIDVDVENRWSDIVLQFLQVIDFLYFEFEEVV